ncbi:ATP-binding protein [Mucilaginibacter sp. AW1-3]
MHIGDNGSGFNTDEQFANAGMGLHNIRKCAEIVGGRLAIESAPGEGTGITIFIPYP